MFFFLKHFLVQIRPINGNPLHMANICGVYLCVCVCVSGCVISVVDDVLHLYVVVAVFVVVDIFNQETYLCFEQP